MTEQVKKRGWDKAESDVDTLLSDATLKVGEETVTVREFRYLEGLEMAALARPLLDALRESGARDGFRFDNVDRLISEHRDIWIQLVAKSADRPPEWVAALGNRDGTNLSMAFWRGNSSFFIQRLVAGAVADRALAEVFRSPKSSPSSSPSASAETTATSASG